MALPGRKDLDPESRERLHRELDAFASRIGGRNPFLGLLEAVRAQSSHPLLSSRRSLVYPHGELKWNKTLYRDKIELLRTIRKEENERGNLLPDPDSRDYKKVLNLLRTLGPVTFTIWPKEVESGKPVTFHALQRIDETTTRLDPIFDAIFFASFDLVKKLLNQSS